MRSAYFTSSGKLKKFPPTAYNSIAFVWWSFLLSAFIIQYKEQTMVNILFNWFNTQMQTYHGSKRIPDASEDLVSATALEFHVPCIGEMWTMAELFLPLCPSIPQVWRSVDGEFVYIPFFLINNNHLFTYMFTSPDEWSQMQITIIDVT